MPRIEAIPAFAAGRAPRRWPAGAEEGADELGRSRLARRRRRSRRAGTGSDCSGLPGQPGGGCRHMVRRLDYSAPRSAAPGPPGAPPGRESYSQLVPGNTGDRHLWLCRGLCRERRGRSRPPVPRAGAGSAGPAGVHVLQHRLVEGEQLVDGGAVSAGGDDRLGRGGAQPDRQGEVDAPRSAPPRWSQGPGVYQFVVRHRDPESRWSCRRTCS